MDLGPILKLSVACFGSSADAMDAVANTTSAPTNSRQTIPQLDGMERFIVSPRPCYCFTKLQLISPVYLVSSPADWSPPPVPPPPPRVRGASRPVTWARAKLQ